VGLDLEYALRGKNISSINDDPENVWGDDDWDIFKRFNISPRASLAYAIPIGLVDIVPGLTWSMQILNNYTGELDDLNMKSRFMNIMFNVGVEFEI
jgi:hypothetical protein